MKTLDIVEIIRAGFW